MPRITIDLTDKALAGLQAEVHRYNKTQETTLTLRQWLTLHLREIAITSDLQVAAEQLHRQQETDATAALEAAIKTARDELLASL